MLGRKGNPVHFSSIENYISDMYLDRMKQEPAEKKKQKAAVIGAGPARMTVAIKLTQQGYGVTIFDRCCFENRRFAQRWLCKCIYRNGCMESA